MSYRLPRLVLLWIFIASAIYGGSWCQSQAAEVLLDPKGYHPQAPKQLRVLSIPGYEKLPIPVLVLDPKHTDVLKHPKLVYKTGLTQRQADGSFRLDLQTIKTPGAYQLKIGNQLLTTTPFIVTLGRYWDDLPRQLGEMDLLQSMPLNARESACEPVSDLAALRVDLGWRSTGRARQKLAVDNAMAVFYLLSWYQANPPVQGTLHFMSRRDRPMMPELLVWLQPNLRWLMSLENTTHYNGFHQGVSWAKTEGGCYHLQSVDNVATLSAIAVLAKAAQVYKKKDLGFAVKSLLTAEKTWEKLDKAKAPVEWLSLAATELWLATKKPVYLKAFLTGVNGWSPHLLAHDQPMPLALSDMLRLDRDIDPALAATLKTALTQPIPSLDSIDGLSHRLLTAVAANEPLWADQVAVAIAQARIKPVSVTEQAQWIWLQGVLNDIYNR